jgi:molybdopterin molybdotransferase
MISFEHALSKLLLLANKIDVEEVNLEEAYSRILANDAISSRDQPPFDASSMDGYALKKIDKLPNKKLSVVGKVAAGNSFKGTIEKGEAVRIFTGAPIPSGANSILIQEDAEELDSFIRIRQKVEKNDFIRKKGCDYKTGNILLKKGKILSSFDLALLASMNLPLLKVTRCPRVSIISTGDELVVPGNLPKNNQIVASNTYGLKALLNKWGAISHILPIARDNKTSLEKALDLAVPADLVITIGGASVGDHDHVSEVFSKIKVKHSFYKVAMRPGKPILAGKNNNTIFVGLPGNPVSALVCAHLFLKPLIGKMLGTSELNNIEKKGLLQNDLPENGVRKHFMRAFLKNGQLVVSKKQDSSLLSVLQKANALVIRQPNEAPAKKGDLITYIELD